MSSLWTKRLLVLALSTFMGLGVLEVAVRFIDRKEILRTYFEAPDPVLHHRFIPSARGWHKSTEFNASYAINSLGLRDREMPREKPPGFRRILMLGDSFTEGNGVEAEEAFPARLQALIGREQLSASWQVVNAGVGSYSPLLEYLYLVNGGLSLQPDLVVLSLDLSDVHDDIAYTRLARFDDQGVPVAVPPEAERKRSWAVRALVAAKDFVRDHMRLYNFVRRRIGGAPFKGAPDDIRVNKYAMLRDGAASQGDREWTLTYRYLTMIRDLLQARGVDFWVAVYPYGLQISPREWGKGRRCWGFEEGRVYSTEPQAFVERFCKANGIPVLNTTGDFQRATQTTYPLYFDYDGHWLPSGHQVMAEALHRALMPSIHGREAPAQVPRASALD
jgi:hypothetical protein